MEIIVNGEEYKLSDRLTIEEWQSVMKYDFTNAGNWANIIHLVTGAPRKVLAQGNLETLELGAAIVVSLCNQRNPVKIKPLDQLTFGEFVDLDSYIALGIVDHLDDMAKILCETEWADEALWAVEQWTNYRLYIFRQYAELFGVYDESEDEEGPDKPIAKDAVARNWYKIIVDLAGDDILKLDAVTDQPLIKTLNFMALRKERLLEENMRVIQQNAKLQKR